MKKIVKMSLVAAVAVAGLTTANAKPLAEAIKDVDVSGTVVYRYNDNNSDANNGSANKTDNNYKIAVNLSSKVNDDLKLNTRTIVGSGTNFVNLPTSAADGNADISLSQVYFSYTGLKNTTVNVGKQGLTTPWTVAIDADGNEQTGTGILALSTWGPVTFAAGWFNQTNLDTSDAKQKTDTTGMTQAEIDAAVAADNAANAKLGATDLYTVGVIGNVGPVVLDGWYAKLDGEDALDVDTFTLGAKANFDIDAAKLGLHARYTDLEKNNQDNSNFEIGANVKVGIFDAKAVYAMTDKDGGLTAFDNDAVTAYNGWNVAINGEKDADLYMIGVGVQALEKLHIAVNYTSMDFGVSEEEEELYTQVTYNMSKNLSTYVRFGTYEVNDHEDDYVGRLQVQYSF